MCESYSRSLLRVSVAQICQALGWDSVQLSACHLLTDVLQRYLQQLGRGCHRYSELYGRTDPILDDVGEAFQLMGVNLHELKTKLKKKEKQRDRERERERNKERSKEKDKMREREKEKEAGKELKYPWRELMKDEDSDPYKFKIKEFEDIDAAKVRLKDGIVRREREKHKDKKKDRERSKREKDKRERERLKEKNREDKIKAPPTQLVLPPKEMALPLFSLPCWLHLQSHNYQLQSR